MVFWFFMVVNGRFVIFSEGRYIVFVKKMIIFEMFGKGKGGF